MTGTSTTRQRRPYAARVPADVRREQLLDAALAIIVRDGYDAISIDAIAREAGVTRPVVYGVYDGLKPLLEALLDRQQARALAQLSEVLPTSFDFADLDGMVAETSRRLIDTVRSSPQTWQPILDAPFGMPEQVRERIDGDRERVRLQIRGLIELGLAFGGGPAVDVDILAHMVMAVLEHFGRLLLSDPDTFDTDRLVDAVTGILRAMR